MKRDGIVLIRSIYRANKCADKESGLERFMDDFEIMKLEVRLCVDLIGSGSRLPAGMQSTQVAGSAPRQKPLARTKRAGVADCNLTSQVFANFYLNPLDHFIKHTVGVRYYGRYGDDFVIVGRDRSCLTALVPQIETFLSRELHLTLHPNKRYLRDVRHGVRFLGAVIKPGRTYPARRTEGHFGAAVARHNRIAEDHKPMRSEQEAFRQSVNSNRGLFRYYSSYRLRMATLRRVCPYWWRYFVVSRTAEKVTVRKTGGACSGVRPMLVSITSCCILVFRCGRHRPPVMTSAANPSRALKTLSILCTLS